MTSGSKASTTAAPGPPSLRREGHVFVLHLGAGDNSLREDVLTALDACLDEVCAATGPTALVTTAGGRTFCAGMDLTAIRAAPDAEAGTRRQVHLLLARMMALPVPTAAAVQGHAFGAGALLALAHDYRVMRRDRGYMCLPEVTVGVPLTVGMAALVSCRAGPRSALEAMTTGRRYDGPDAVTAGLVDEAVDVERVLDRAMRRAEALALTSGPTLGTIKRAALDSALTSLNRGG